MTIECEAKIQVDTLRTVRNLLLAHGAQTHGVRFERNWILDDHEGTMRKKGVLLRIRSHGEVGGFLTVKKPASKESLFKTREEIESPLESTDVALSQFAGLDYRVVWIYEKYRETWDWGHCQVMLDECPEIGSFVEIEGEPEHIRQAAFDLGLDPARHIRHGYRKLWRKHLAARGEKARPMVFSRRSMKTGSFLVNKLFDRMPDHGGLSGRHLSTACLG